MNENTREWLEALSVADRQHVYDVAWLAAMRVQGEGLDRQQHADAACDATLDVLQTANANDVAD